MIRNVLSHIGGVEAYGIFSVLLFFIFFSVMLVWAIRLRRVDLEHCGALPLAADDLPASHLAAATPGTGAVANTHAKLNVNVNASQPEVNHE